MPAEPSSPTPPPHPEPTAESSGNLLWIIFAAMMIVVAVILLCAIFRDIIATADYMAGRDTRFKQDLENVQKQNEIIIKQNERELAGIRNLEKAAGLPASQPSSAP